MVQEYCLVELRFKDFFQYFRTFFINSNTYNTIFLDNEHLNCETGEFHNIFHFPCSCSVEFLKFSFTRDVCQHSLLT